MKAEPPTDEPKHITRFRQNIECADQLAGRGLHSNPDISRLLRPTGRVRRQMLPLHKTLMAWPHEGRQYSLGEMRATVQKYDAEVSFAKSGGAETVVVGYVYRVDVAGESYVGQTSRTVTARWVEHEKEAFERNSLLPVHVAMRQAGRIAISFHTLEVVTLPENLDQREQYWMDEYGVELNGRRQLGRDKRSSRS